MGSGEAGRYAPVTPGQAVSARSAPGRWVVYSWPFPVAAKHMWRQLVGRLGVALVGVFLVLLYVVVLHLVLGGGPLRPWIPM